MNYTTQRDVTLAYVIRGEAMRRYGSVKAYADAFGLSYQRLSAVLRGDQIIRLEDIVSAERNLNAAPAILRALSIHTQPSRSSPE